MSHAPQRFRMREVTRILKAAQSAGREVERLEIAPDGKISLFPKSQSDGAKESYPNEWDPPISAKAT